MVEIDKFKVKELMAKKQIATLQELANSLGISKTQLSNILSDKFVPIKSNVIELADFLEVSPLELIKEKDLKEILPPIVEKGIADAETVDEALRYGPGLRWPILGILENADMIGLDLSLNIQEYIVPHLEDSHSASTLLKKHVADGNLGFKTGKGYQTWTEEEIKASRKRLNEYLIDVTKDLK